MRTTLTVLLLCLAFITHTSVGAMMPLNVSSPTDCPHHAEQMVDMTTITSSAVPNAESVTHGCVHCGFAVNTATSSACDGCDCASVTSMPGTADMLILLSLQAANSFVSPLSTLLSQPPPQLLRPPRS